MTTNEVAPARVEKPRRGKRAGPRELLSRSSGILLIIALGLAWQLSVEFKLIDSPTLPKLSFVLESFITLLFDGTYASAFGASMWRLFVGYTIGCVAAVALGIAMGYFRAIERLLDPLVEILRPIPSPAYIPMAILFLGIGDEMKIFMVAFTCFFPILLNTVSGVKSVDSVIVNTGRTFGLRQNQIVRKLVLPASAPYILTGMRISLAVALIITVISEMVAGNSGVGYLLLTQQRTFRIPDMYSTVVALALVGFLMNKAFVLAEARVLRWNVEVRG